MPAVEFARAIGLQGLRVVPPLIARHPGSLPDPACQCGDEALRTSGAQAAHQAAVILHLAVIEALTDHVLRPRAISLAARIFHDDVAVARGAERAVQPGDLLLQPKPFRIDHDRCEERYGGP